MPPNTGLSKVTVLPTFNNAVVPDDRLNAVVDELPTVNVIGATIKSLFLS